MERLSDIGEDALIQRLLAKLSVAEDSADKIVVAPGDDCAVIDIGQRDQYQLLKTDALVEGVHYLPNTPAGKVGWKAIARVVSDFAAMGGTPSQLLVTVAMPPNQKVSYTERLYEGMQKCASKFGATISGGETTSVPIGSAAMITISGTGWVEKNRCVVRSGGKVGDHVFVTGKLGGSIHGKHLTFSPRLPEARWLTEHFQINAMMDLSDGLGRDLPRLACASECAYQIDESALPRNRGCDVSSALHDGEDYELLFTLRADQASDLLAVWEDDFPDVELTNIGLLVKGHESSGGQINGGWQHFSS